MSLTERHNFGMGSLQLLIGRVQSGCDTHFGTPKFFRRFGQPMFGFLNAALIAIEYRQRHRKTDD